jgi:hypothetical protein
MNGNLEPEEHVMDDSVRYPGRMLGELAIALEKLGWECGDDVAVEIGGTTISGIHQGEDYNKKWATPFGVRKYNKDAFIVIKNLSRTPFEPSLPMDREHAPHHLKDAKPESTV